MTYALISPPLAEVLTLVRVFREQGHPAHLLQKISHFGPVELDDLAPESKLLGFLDAFLLLGRESWQGKACEIERMLTDQNSPYSYEARKLFSWPSACGTYLGRLRRRFPDRFQFAQTGDERDRTWTILPKHPPAKTGVTIEMMRLPWVAG